MTIGWPDLIGMALARRGDVRVLAVDAGHQGSSFVQRLERIEIDSELVPTEAASIAVAAADLVLIEADALDGSDVIAATGSSLLAAAAGLHGTPVWCVAGCGRRLPTPMIEAIVERVAQRAIDPWSREVESLPTSLVVARRRPARPAAGHATCAPSARWRRSCCAPGSCSARRPTVRSSMPSRRSNITMTDDEVVAYLEEQKVLNVATIGPTGHPHVVAMWYVVLDGKPAFWTFGKSQKIMNIRRDPKITGLVESGDTYDQLRGVELVGTARLLEDHDTILDLGVRVSTKYSGPPSDAALPFIEKQAQKRIGVVIDVDHVVSWDHTKLAGAY